MMKRIIAAALSVLVGAFGYNIVDKALEDRVATLESEVVELREIISGYHTSQNNTGEFYNTTTSKSDISNPGDDKLNDPVIGPNGEQFLGYKYDAAGDFYYTDDKECWKPDTGFNEVYDSMTPITAMYIDVLRIHFTYGDKDWMIQLWKGQYGFLLVGAEIGVYTTDAGTYTGEIGDINHYDCADKEDWLNMEMTCYWKENNQGSYEEAFHREYNEYWWATGFVKGQLTKYTAPRTELKTEARITFKSEEMADLFVEGLKESGFEQALSREQLIDDSFYQSGADVWFLWHTKNHECFPGYTATTTTANLLTTHPATVVPSTTYAPMYTTVPASKNW